MTSYARKRNPYSRTRSNGAWGAAAAQDGRAVQRAAIVRKAVFPVAGARETSGYIAAGRYVLTPSIFRYLEQAPAAGTAESGLHDALRSLLAHESVVAYEISGERFSCRTKFGLLSATVHYGLKHPELAEPFRELLGQVKAGSKQPAGVATSA